MGERRCGSIAKYVGTCTSMGERRSTPVGWSTGDRITADDTDNDEGAEWSKGDLLAARADIFSMGANMGSEGPWLATAAAAADRAADEEDNDDDWVDSGRCAVGRTICMLAGKDGLAGDPAN